jgi:hypothetical protein
MRLINKWIESKINYNLDRNGKELSFYGLGLEWFLPLKHPLLNLLA